MLGAASPLHAHHREEECFFVAEGEARLFVGDQRIDARAGDLVALPRDAPHAYLITSPTARPTSWPRREGSRPSSAS